VFIKDCEVFRMSRGSAVGIATGYGLDDKGRKVLVPPESRMSSSGLLRRVALVRTDVSEELYRS
jgi:hypothetical protein